MTDFCTERPRRGRRHMATLLAWVAALCLVALSCNFLQATAEGTVVVDPPMPLFNVPFRVTASFLQPGQVLFLSRSSKCDLKESFGSVCTLPDNRTCTFTVASASMGVSVQYVRMVPELYICTSAISHRSIRSLQLYVIDASPRFVRKGVSCVVTLSNATPVGSFVGFFREDSCKEELPNMAPVALGEDRKVSITISEGGVLFLCARIFVKGKENVESLTPYLPASTLLVVPQFSVENTQVLRHTTNVFSFTNIDQLPFASFSRSKDCEILLQEPVKGQVLHKIELPIHVPKGEYYFCIGLAYYKQEPLYVSSENRVTVRQYGVQPHTIYAGLPTMMSLTLDAEGSNGNGTKSIALFNSPDCKGGMVIGWSKGTAWTVPLPGVYYACVRESDSESATAALATNISVLSPPLTSMSDRFPIRGLDVTVTLKNLVVSNHGVITAGLSLTRDCFELFSKETVTERDRTVTLPVPWNVSDTACLCVSTPLSTQPLLNGEEPDRGYTYALDTIKTRSYNVSHASLFAGKKGSMTLDPRMPFDAHTMGVFARDGCSKAVGNIFSMNVSVLNEIVFKEAGTYSLCVKLPRAASYVRIGEVLVYGLVKLSPISIIAGTPTDVTVSRIPPNSHVSIVASTNCTSASLVKGVADATGKVKLLQLTYPTETTLTLCVGYKGTDSLAWNVMPVDGVPVTGVKVFPQAVVATQTNRVNFIVPDKLSLSGFEVFFVRGAAASCDGAGHVTLPVRIPDRGQAFVLYHFSDAAKWTVCLGKTGSDLKPIGEITSMTFLKMTATPSTGVVGLPVRLQFSGPLLSAIRPTRFFVTDKAESCVQPALESLPFYGEGVMDAFTGFTDTFVVVKEGKLTVCVGKKTNEENSFVFGGTIEVGRFKPLSRYAIRESLNNLTAFPFVRGASLFLVACVSKEMCTFPVAKTTCLQAKQRYYTSLLVPLRGAAVGSYLLCQEDKKTKAIAASDTLVSVVNPFAAKILDAEVRRYKSVKVRLSGGDVKTRREAMTVFTLPQGVACDEADAQREDFVFPAGVVDGTIVVTKIDPFVNQAQLCVKASSSDVFSLTKFDVLPYMSPATIITDRKMHVRSGALKDEILVKLTAKADCRGNVMDHEPAQVKRHIAELYLKGCSSGNRALTAVHYCESFDGGANYEHRGVMSLIRLRGCDSDSPAAIMPVTVPPAKPIVDYGIDTNLLARPKLSRTSDCKGLIQHQNGYVPQYDEVAEFFVCVSAKNNPDYVFTTDTPTLRVDNFMAIPSSIPSRVSATIGVPMPRELTLNYPTGTTQTYLSHFTNCNTSFATTPGLASESPRAPVLLTGVLGPKYVCAATVNGDRKALAVLLVVNPPTTSMIDPALVRGAPFRATFRVLSESGRHPLYSLIPGEDTQFTFAHLYTYFFRGIFLSNDACESVLRGSKVAYAGDSGRVALSTKKISNGLTVFSLCAGTPAGNVTVLSGIEVSSAIIFPSQFVLGSDVNVYIPLSPNSVFHLRQDGNCGSLDIVPPFITNNEGHGTLSLKRFLGHGLPPAGRWTLCKKTDTSGPSQALSNQEAWKVSSLSLRPLVVIETFNPAYYNIRGSVVVVGIPTVVVLLDDLKAGNLLPGFSTDKSCTNLGDSYGSWRLLPGESAAESRRIAIEAVEPAPAIYLCAVTPINKSVVSVPFKGALQFVTSENVFPSTLSRCGSTKLNSCALPGSPPSGAFVTVVKGDCCNIAHRRNVVGRLTRTSDNQCSLEMDSMKVNDYPPHSEFSVCAWDATDHSYCTTLGHVKVGNDACAKENGVLAPVLSNGALIAILVFAVIFGVLLIVLLTCFVVECYRRRTWVKELSVATDSQRSQSELNPLTLYSAKSGNVLLGRGEQLLIGPNGAHFIAGSQRAISVGTCTDPAAGLSCSRDVSPDVLRLSLWDGIESDERDQIALMEARERYNVRLAFTEACERMRVAEKERALEFELSDDEKNPFETHKPDFAAVCVPSAPSESPAMLFDESPKGKAGSAEAASAVCYAFPVSVDRDERVSFASSLDAMNYTTTQRFFDDWRFTLDNEAVRRQRIVNWEDEDWHALVDAEFSAYLHLQQRTLPPPLPPAPLPDRPTSGRDDSDDAASVGRRPTPPASRNADGAVGDEEEMMSGAASFGALMSLRSRSGYGRNRSEQLEENEEAERRTNHSERAARSVKHYADPLGHMDDAEKWGDVDFERQSVFSDISDGVPHKRREGSS